MAGGPNFPQPNRPQSPLLPSPFTFSRNCKWRPADTGEAARAEEATAHSVEGTRKRYSATYEPRRRRGAALSTFWLRCRRPGAAGATGLAGRCPCLRHRAERRPQGGCHRGCRLHLVAAIGEALGGASGQPAARSHIVS